MAHSLQVFEMHKNTYQVATLNFIHPVTGAPAVLEIGRQNQENPES